MKKSTPDGCFVDVRLGMRLEVHTITHALPKIKAEQPSIEVQKTEDWDQRLSTYLCCEANYNLRNFLPNLEVIL